MKLNDFETRVGPWNMTAYPEYIRAICTVKSAVLNAATKSGKIETELADAWTEGYRKVAGELNNLQALKNLDVYLGFGHRLYQVIDALAMELGNIKEPTNQIEIPEYALSCTVLHVVVCDTLPRLLKETKRFQEELSRKALQFASVKKKGRKCLRDAAETTLGAEFAVFSEGFSEEINRLEDTMKRWGYSWIGLGYSGVDALDSTDEETRKCACSTLTRLTGTPFATATTAPDLLNALTNLLALHANLQHLSIQLWRVAHDIRIMCSGPRTGIAEITVPAVAPGSSIMPGKLNPVMAEMVYTSVDQIDANHAGIAVALKCGWLESTANSSVPIRNYLDSCLILTNTLKLFNDKCLVGIEPNSDKHSLQRVIERS